MLVAFVESFKYVGHLAPVAFLRVFIGYSLFSQGWLKLKSDFLSHAYLAEGIRAFLPRSAAPEWYKVFLEAVVMPNWQVFASVVMALQLAIGISYIFGYLVRAFSLVAVALTIALMYALGSDQSETQTSLMIVLHFTLGWLGAGRCLGFDYYFYKRRRGLWW